MKFGPNAVLAFVIEMVALVVYGWAPFAYLDLPVVVELPVALLVVTIFVALWALYAAPKSRRRSKPMVLRRSHPDARDESRPESVDPNRPTTRALRLRSGARSICRRSARDRSRAPCDAARTATGSDATSRGSRSRGPRPRSISPWRAPAPRGRPPGKRSHARRRVRAHRARAASTRDRGRRRT